MKIAILSFQNVFNYGGQLQNYALYRVLDEKGYDCEVFDYDCSVGKDYFPIRHPQGIKQIISAVLLNPSRIRRQEKFTKFRRLIHYSPKCDRNNIRMISERYEKIIVGSDQVWNMRITNGDYNFFLEFVGDDNKKIAYAASFGVDGIPQNQKIQKLLTDFKMITVREIEAANIINNLISRGVDVVLDPTLLLDRGKWETVSASRLVSFRYILVYMIDENEKNLEAIRKYAFDHRCKILYIRERHRPIKGFIQIHDAGPEEFLSYIKYADCVFTGSFHACCFSVIFHKLFYCTYNNDGLGSRLNSLFKILKIEPNYIENYHDFNYRFIDYNRVDAELNKKRAWSLSKLMEMINDKNCGE